MQDGEQQETAGNSRSKAISLQSQLEQEKEQHLTDISRTTQTHANLLSDATESIKRLQVLPLAPHLAPFRYMQLPFPTSPLMLAMLFHRATMDCEWQAAAYDV